MSHNLVDIIIPTWNNQYYLQQALGSIISNRSSEGLFHIYVVNNGHPESCNWIASPFVTVLQTGGENLGWEGGLKLALKDCKAPFVCFFNDDAHIPPSSRLWLNQLLQHFKDPLVGAVGPSSNVVMGMQNVFAQVPFAVFVSKFLIGFCLLIRRTALDEVGGIDDTLPGGDDLDLSIRLRKAGKKLIVNRDVFVYHHGFKTGERIHGTADKTGGWNSYEFKEKTDLALIRKHGFRSWWETMQGVWKMDETTNANVVQAWEDIEGDLIRERIAEGTVVYDLGCGSNKTVSWATGIDMVAKDEIVETLTGRPTSAADIQGDVSQPLPVDPGSADVLIARHIMEHMLDPITTLRYWVDVLKPGGKLIVAVPLEGLVNSIPMNIEHKHAWDPPAMRTLLESVGLKVVEQIPANNGVSFLSVARKEENVKTA